MATVEFKFDVKPASYITDNPTKVLSDGEPIFLEDGRYGFGDNSTQLQNLTLFGTSADTSTRLLTGGTISVVTDDVTVAASTYYISGQGNFSAAQTAFNNITLSSSGTQRYVGFFGNTSSAVVKVEGTESSVAAYPDTPADACPIGYVLVTDAAYTPEEPEDVTFSNIGGNASDNASLVAYVKNPRVSSITSSSTPGLDVNLYDHLHVTALVANATFSAPTGSLSDGRKIIYRIKDNGTARTLSFNSVFRASTDLSLPTTTTVNKVLYLGFIYNSTAAKWDLLAKLDNF